MEEQYRLSKGPLLDEKGELIEAGYHEDLIKTYARKDVYHKHLRLKEWDYYYIGNDKHGVAVTLADNSYMYLASVTIFDFEKKLYHTEDKIGFSFKGLNMPESSRIGDVIFKKGGFSFKFLHEVNQRHLFVEVEKFMGKKFSLDVILKEKENTSIVIATPFLKKKHFYYNHKINLMTASGSYTVGQTIYPIADAFGTLDWGRGVWTYQNTWYWSSASGLTKDGQTIGFNLGYGFGDLSSATENMFYYDNKAYKLKDITFIIPKNGEKDDYMKPWILKSSDDSVNLKFEPILDRNSNANLLVIKSIQHQVFGKFSGYVTIHNNQKIEVNQLMGFAEKVMNRW